MNPGRTRRAVFEGAKVRVGIATANCLEVPCAGAGWGSRGGQRGAERLLRPPFGQRTFDQAFPIRKRLRDSGPRKMCRRLTRRQEPWGPKTQRNKLRNAAEDRRARR